MSLRPQRVPAVPEETVRVARASFPRGSLYMRLRDELGAVFDDACFAGLFPARGRPAEAPWRLALVTSFQFAEGLPDRQAAEAVRGRIDWKYALALSLTDPGFDSTVLSEFRSRLVKGQAEQVLLDVILALARKRDLLSAGGRQRTDSTHVLAVVRALNRLECVTETMRHALESLAVAAPDWLRVCAQSDWVKRYGHRAMDEPSAKKRCPPGRARTGHRPGWPCSPAGGARPNSTTLAATASRRRDLAPRLGATVLSFRRGRTLAHRRGRHPAGRDISEFAL